MDSELIIITEYCNNSQVEPQFIILLEEEGLISTEWIDGEQYLAVSQLRDIERYASWHYDLSINIEGIDTIQKLLYKIEEMQSELVQLRKALDINKSDDALNFDNDLFN